MIFNREKIKGLIKEEIDYIKENKFPNSLSFKKFFTDKLKETGWYDDKKEIKNEVKFTIENMKYDMKHGDTLNSAFEKACRDLHIEKDGIEKYL